MSIEKKDLGNNCFEFDADDGDKGWIAVFTSNGVEVKQIRYWRENPGATEWTEGPFRTEKEAWAFIESVPRF